MMMVPVEHMSKLVWRSDGLDVSKSIQNIARAEDNKHRKILTLAAYTCQLELDIVNGGC